MTSVVSMFSTQDEDIKVFTDATRESRVGIAAWKRISAYKKNNEASLADEMDKTALDLEIFIEDLESDCRVKRFRRESFGSDVYDICKNINDDISGKIELGNLVMERVNELIGINGKKRGQGDMSLQSSKATFDETGSLDSERLRSKERIDKISERMKHLMTRFARILDEEGIEHKLPVPKLPPRRRLTLPAYEVKEPKEYYASRDAARKRDASEMRSKSLSTTMSRSSKATNAVSKSTKKSGCVTAVRSPLQFLEDYAGHADLNVELTQVRATRTAWYLEYIFTCKLFNIVGEGRGKSKEIAKQEAASQVITGIISRQKRGLLATELPPLTAKQMDFGNSLLCETIDYEEELVEICSKSNYRPPIFTTVTSGPPIFVLRCNALNANALGKGKNKPIAKRMAAKNVIELAMQEKRRAKEAMKLLVQPNKPIK